MSILNFPETGWINPLVEIERLRREMDRLYTAFHRGAQTRIFSSGGFPLVNVSHNRDNYIIRAELCGVTPEDVKVEVSRGNLVISGERKIPSEGKDVKYHLREREGGKFIRIIGLPEGVDSNNVKATMANGLLTITLAKSDAGKPTRIRVNHC